MNKIILIGYSGHAYVACDILLSMKKELLGYCEAEKKTINPYNLEYLGSERTSEVQELIRQNKFFIAVGENQIREKLFKGLKSLIGVPVNSIHAASTISSTATLGNGVMVGAGVVINALSEIGDGVICNTASIIEHECKIHNFVHIAPGAILCGDVEIGERSFIGARTVIRQGIKIGKDVLIGAGSVIVKDIPDNCKVIGTKIFTA